MKKIYKSKDFRIDEILKKENLTWDDFRLIKERHTMKTIGTKTYHKLFSYYAYGFKHIDYWMSENGKIYPWNDPVFISKN